MKEIRNGLKNRGYNVVDIETYNYPIDAIVYEDQIMQISHITPNNMPEMLSGTRSNYGVFMINSKGKSVDEIVKMLKTRSYGNLF